MQEIRYWAGSPLCQSLVLQSWATDFDGCLFSHTRSEQNRPASSFDIDLHWKRGAGYSGDGRIGRGKRGLASPERVPLFWGRFY